MCKKAVESARAFNAPSQMSQAAKIFVGNLPNIDTTLFPVPIKKIAEDCGFKVLCQIYEQPELSGIIGIDDAFQQEYETSRIIGVNNEDNVGDQRFTIAHELAHYIFDYDENKDVTYYNTYKTNETETLEEQRANKFATNLLMPYDEFLKQYSNTVQKGTEPTLTDLITLSNFFGVSISAIRRRIKELTVAD